ncbi:MAG: YsnF/AvaK domain-containing protein [Limisphaerales bacterium]
MIKQLSYVTGIISVAGFLSACATHHHYASNEPCGEKTTAYSTTTTTEAAGAQPATMATGNEVAIPLYEERVNVSKQEVPSQVQLRKYTTTETVSVPVELRHEHVVIERGPASAGGSTGEAFQDKSVGIQLQNEQPVIQKQTVQTGSVIARKDSSTQQVNIQSQVRKEDVSVDKSGNPNVEVRGNINEAAGAQSPQQQQPQQQNQEQK